MGPLSFDSPVGLTLLALLVPLVLLYILKTKRPRVKVASTWLWRAAARDAMARSPWKKLRAEASLLLEALALVALAIALARPVTRTTLGSRNTYALVVDVSASMAARSGDKNGSRLDAAKEAVHEWLRGLPRGARVLVVEAGRDARLASGFETDGHRLDAVVDSLAALDVEGDLDAGVALAADRLSAIDGAEIVVVTDGNVAHPPRFEGVRVPIDVITVGTPIDNVAILRVAASTDTDASSHKDTTRVFALVANFGGAPREVYATLRREGGDKNASTAELLASRRLVIAAGEHAPLVLSFAPDAGDIGSGVILDVSPHDAFPTDDVAFVRVPDGPRLRVVLATKGGQPSPWLERALGSDRNVELIRADVGQLRDMESSHTPGLVVVEGACPIGPFAEDFAIVHPPIGDCRGGRIVAGLEHPSITSWATGDPRMRFLSFDGVEIAQSDAFLVDDPSARLLRAGEQTLIADVSDTGRTGTLVAFDVGETNWPLRASFVVFVRNLLEQARSDRDRATVLGARTGEPIRLAVPPDVARLNIVSQSGRALSVQAEAGVALVPALNHPGIYHAELEGRPGEIVLPVNLASAAESDLGSKLTIPPRGDITVRRASEARLAFRELGYAFVAAALLFILLDVWLVTRGSSFTRRPVLVGAVIVSLGLAGYALVLGFGWARETFLRLERPWAMAILPFVMLLVASRLSDKARSGRSRARITIEDCAASLLSFALVLGIAGPSIGRALHRLTVIVAIDRSRSMDLVPDAGERFSAEIKRAETSMRADDRIGTVAFGATAATEEPPHRKDEKLTAQRIEVPRDATDIDRALRRALSDVPSDSAARIVLLSDGVGNRGDALSGAAATLAAEVPVDTLALEQREVPDVRVVSLLGPTRGNAGEAIDFRVVTQATQETPVELRVLLDGTLVSKSKATLARGEDVLRLREKLPGPGLHHYEVEIAANDPTLDVSADDNAGSAFVRVRGDAEALVLEGDGGESAFVTSALRAAGFQVDERGLGGAPADLGGFARYDLVVLSDIPAASLAGAQIDALASYVRDFGGGLWLMGGDRSLGPGGYGKSAIEEVSPLSFDLKKKVRRASLAEVIGIDISGSMGMVVDGRTKLELANEAAARSAALLGDTDHLGVEHVDTEVHWSVPLGPIVDRAGIERAIRGVSVGGGGIIVPITLEAGYAALDKETTSLKHMLLFADGDDAEEIKAAMPSTPAAKARGITTSTVALGSGKDIADLQEMARLGGGRFYLVEDASRLPSVFAEETILASRAAISEEPFHVAPGAASPATLGIDFGAAPALKGYVVTIPKERATVSLLGPDGDPVLASWQIGVGRCGVFTSDLKDRWGVDWTSWPPAARLVAQMARDLQRRADDERVSLEADTIGGDLHVRATASFDDKSADSFRRLTVHIGGPDGFARDVDLDPVGTGAYAATVPLTRPGTYIAVAKDEASGVVVSSTGAVLGRGEELRPTGTDHAMLGRIAKLTGGKVRTSLEGIFDDRPRTRFAYEDVSRALIVAAAVLVLALVASRRLSILVPQLKLSASPAGTASTTETRASPTPEARVNAPRPGDAPEKGEAPAPSPSIPTVKPPSADASTAEHLAAKRRKRRERQ